MKQNKRMPIYTIVSHGATYRFTDVLDHGTYFTGKRILDNGQTGKMIHRITREEMEHATIEQEQNND